MGAAAATVDSVSAGESPDAATPGTAVLAVRHPPPRYRRGGRGCLHALDGMFEIYGLQQVVALAQFAGFLLKLTVLAPHL